MATEAERFKYVCSEGNSLMSTHTVCVDSGNLKRKGCIGLLLAVALLMIAVEGEVWWMLLLLALFLALLLRKGFVKEEVVVVMPSLGVQLEAVYDSGKVHRRFVPMHTILAAIINEAVTPTHCYFYLALILRDETKLTLVFKETRPPLRILVPIWRCLTDSMET